MRLRELELENWGCHGSLKVDLTGGLQIEGRNGTGKSSILEALRFVFKETARGYLSRIKNGERYALVRLTFDRDGTTYLIEKRLHVDKASTALMLMGETQVADNPSSVHERIQSLLSEDVLDKLLYIPQGGLNNILERLSGKEGKLEMDRLFGLDRLERVWERTGQEIQESEGKLSAYRQQLSGYPEDCEREYIDSIRRLEDELGRLAEESEVAGKELEKAVSDLRQLEEKISLMSETKKRIDCLKNDLNDSKLTKTSSEKELESLKAKHVEIEDKRGELTQLRQSRSELERYRYIREGLSEMEKVEASLRDRMDVRGERQRLTDLDRRLKDLQELERMDQKVKSDLKACESEYTLHKAELERLAVYYEQLGSLEGKAKCPRCGQRLNAFITDRERNETAVKIKNLEEGRKRIHAKLEMLKVRAIESEKKLSDALRDKAERQQLKTTVEKKEAEVVELMEKLNDLREGLGRFDYVGEEVGFVQSKCDELNELDGRIKVLSKEVEGYTKLAEKISSLKNDLAKVEGSIREYEKLLSELVYDEGEHIRQGRIRDDTSDRKFQLKSHIKDLEGESRRKASEISDSRKKLKQYMDIKGSYDTVKKQLDLLRKAREVFHRDRGLVKYLRENNIHRLNALTSHHFKRINQNPRYVDVSFDRDYNIVFRTLDGQLCLSQISGGEMAQLALAVRIALIELMSPINLMVLDEPFGSLDEIHREILGESLNRISRQGQLILVTHVHVESLQLPKRLDLGGY